MVNAPPPPPDLTRHRNSNYPFFMMAQSSPQRLARLRGTSQNRLPSPSSSSHAASSREASTSHVPSSQTKTDIPPQPPCALRGSHHSQTHPAKDAGITSILASPFSWNLAEAGQSRQAPCSPRSTFGSGWNQAAPGVGLLSPGC